MFSPQALKPQIFVSVPRLWNRIYDRVMATVREANPVSRSLFERAYAYKKAAIDSGDLSGGRWGPFWDRLVFSKIRAKLGGEIKYMTSGRAEGVSWRGGPGEGKAGLVGSSCHVFHGHVQQLTKCLLALL